MGFPRQEYWAGLPFPPPEDLPDPGIKPASPAWQAYSLPLSHQGSPYGILTIMFHASREGNSAQRIKLLLQCHSRMKSELTHHLVTCKHKSFKVRLTVSSVFFFFFFLNHDSHKGFPADSAVKNLPAIQEMWETENIHIRNKCCV